jgi:hypothetical protein
MENNNFGLKDLYDCVLTATYDIEVGDRIIKAGEPVAVFDSISLANLHEIKERTYAKGGYGNGPWITWESTEAATLDFSQGVFSKTHLQLLANAISKTSEEVKVPMRESKEIDDNLQVQLKYNPIPSSVYIYKKNNGERIKNYEINNNVMVFKNIEPYTDIEIIYNFSYINADVIYIGRRLFKGFLSLTAKTRLKDDMTGKTITGILSMPKVTLMSDFSIRLGNDAPPATGHFSVTAYPTGSKGSEQVMEFISLNDDVDSDF